MTATDKLHRKLRACVGNHTFYRIFPDKTGIFLDFGSRMEFFSNKDYGYHSPEKLREEINRSLVGMGLIDEMAETEGRYSGPLKLSNRYEGEQSSRFKSDEEFERIFGTNFPQLRWGADHRQFIEKNPEDLFRDIISEDEHPIYPTFGSSEDLYTGPNGCWAPTGFEVRPDNQKRAHAAEELAYRFDQGQRDWVNDFVEFFLDPFFASKTRENTQYSILVEFMGSLDLVFKSKLTSRPAEQDK